MVHVKRRKNTIFIRMNRDAILQLLFWVPIGLLCMLYLLVDNNPRLFPALGKKPSSGIVWYNLVEETTMVNTYGETCKVLRYACGEKMSGDAKSFVPLSVLECAQRMSNNNDDNNNAYVEGFIDILAKSPMDAFFFETRGMTYSQSQEETFEFVLVESSYLKKFADAEQDVITFSERFEECKKSPEEGRGSDEFGCVFSNLGGDSMLVAPFQIDMTNTNIYGHLAAFVRRAPKQQVIHFMKLVMQTYIERLKSEEPNKVWLSTDGSGVAWLHIRLDPSPKYYDYTPYAQEGSE